MAIVRTGPSARSNQPKGRIKCWTCNQPASVFAVNANGNSVCIDCEPKLFAGVIQPARKRAKAPKS